MTTDLERRMGSRWRRTVGFVAVLLVGAMLGWAARDFFGTDRASRAGQASSIRSHPTMSPDSSSAEADRNDESMKFWAATALALAARTGGLEALLDDLDDPTSSPRASLEQAIAESSDRELAAIVSAVTRIDEDDLLTQGDLRPFATRLVGVALDGLDGPSSEPEPPRRVIFTTDTGDPDPAATAQTRFAPDEGRIFAMIRLDDHDGDRVLVKWLNEDTKRVHSLQSMKYDPGQPLWSYLARDAKWDRGRYEVSFYSQDSQMTLLGRGGFTVF